MHLCENISDFTLSAFDPAKSMTLFPLSLDLWCRLWTPATGCAAGSFPIGLYWPKELFCSIQHPPFDKCKSSGIFYSGDTNQYVSSNTIPNYLRLSIFTTISNFWRGIVSKYLRFSVVKMQDIENYSIFRCTSSGSIRQIPGLIRKLDISYSLRSLKFMAEHGTLWKELTIYRLENRELNGRK